MEKKNYGLFTAVTMIVGIVIGSGIFFKSDNILIYTDGDVLKGCIVFILAAFAIVFGSLTIGKLATMTDKTGGVTAYAEEFGNRSWSSAFGWFFLFVYYPTLCAIIAWVAGIYTSILFGWDTSLEQQILMGMIVVVFIFTVNSLSAKLGGIFQNCATVIKMIPLVIIAVCGLIFGDPGATLTAGTVVEGAQALGWLAAIGPIAFSFDGWIVATSISHEIKDSKKNLPRALIYSPILILGVYLLYFVGMTSYVGAETVMSLGDAHVDYAANLLFGASGAKIVITFVVISVIGTVNGLALGMVRIPHALAVRKSFPKPEKFTTMNKRFNMPIASGVVCFVVVSVWMVVHYFTTKYSMLPNSDVSEIAIAMQYILFIFLYYQVFRLYKEGKIKSAISGVVIPIFATIGSLFVLIGSASSQGILFIFYCVFCLAVAGIGALYSKSQNK